ESLGILGMNPEPQSLGELARPATNPADVIAVGPSDIARVVPSSGSVPAKTAAATAFTRASILRALYRRQLLALSVAVVATAIAGPAAWFGLPPAKYKALAQLQVKAQPPKVLFPTIETELHDDYRRYQNTQQALVKSQFVLGAAVRDKVSQYQTIRA